MYGEYFIILMNAEKTGLEKNYGSLLQMMTYCT